jgi:2,4-dienoyl-CoA reductase-like NADH-dependent reductase (Old Yellow Enzyme family)
MYKNRSLFFKFIMKKLAEKIIKPIPFSQAYNRESAGMIKSKVNVPVFVVGGMTDPKVMQEIVRKGEADYIAMCRPLIADAKFPEKIQEGIQDLNRCIHCNLCLAYMFTKPLRCYHGKKLFE